MKLVISPEINYPAKKDYYCLLVSDNEKSFLNTVKAVFL
jgi:hypothetical protein